MSEPMLFIFDKDGTICQSKFGNKFINSLADQELIPGVAGKCEKLRAQGHMLAVASNQGGVAWGFMNFDDASAIVAHSANLIGARDYIFCPHHPDVPNDPKYSRLKEYHIECNCRKPKPGMLFDLALFFKSAQVIFIGDMLTDKQAAEAFGCKFIWAWEFFDRPPPLEG